MHNNEKINPRSVRTDERVQQAYEELMALNREVNFSSVAKRAHVSRQYLYKSPKWNELINRARDKKNEPELVSNDAEQSEIARLKLRILALEKENAKLQDQIDAPHKYIGKANKLEQENSELKATNTKLRKEISELKKQLETAYSL